VTRPTRVRLRRGAGRRLAAGHRWVFSNELERVPTDLPPGTEVVVEDARGRVLGTGDCNPHSLIAVRIHTPWREAILDRPALAARLRAALDLRRRALGEEAAACRVAFGEADALPGLVVDRFGDRLAVQILTAGMERRREAVLSALEEVLAPRGIVLRNDAPARALEGLRRAVETVGDVPERVWFRLGELELAADLVRGQKTGFFFDQRENYRLLRPFAPGAEVLDAFCYSGAWGLSALTWGAKEVTFLDASAGALDLVRANLERNGLAGGRTVRGEGVPFLKEAARTGRRWDVVILDPPAFAKSRRHVPEALRGYLNLNAWGLRCVRPGGALVTCSCSHHVRPGPFTEAVARAAARAGRTVRVVGRGAQGPDHPWLPGMPETAYLKVLLLVVE